MTTHHVPRFVHGAVAASLILGSAGVGLGCAGGGPRSIDELTADEEVTRCPVVDRADVEPVVEEVLGLVIDEETVTVSAAGRGLVCGFQAAGEPVFGIIVRAIEGDEILQLLEDVPSVGVVLEPSDRAFYQRLVTTGSAIKDGLALSHRDGLLVMLMPGHTSGFFGGAAAELDADELRPLLAALDPMVRANVVAGDG